MPAAVAEPLAAVLDVGSNSVLLLTVAVTPAGRAVVHDEALATTRLGTRLVPGGALDAAARARTRDAVVGFAARARAAGATRVWAYATGAARRAGDGAAFVAELAGAADCQCVVLSGDDEARLAYAAAGLAGAPAADRLVVDVGGGTTELTRGRGPAILESVSLPLGALALTERHGADAGGCAATIAAALATTALPSRATDATLVVSGGTASALAAIDLGLPAYDPSRSHRHRLAVARLTALAARGIDAGIDPGRARLLPAGAAVLAGVARAAGRADVVVSELAVRHAYLQERLAAEGVAGDFGAPWR
jgi:exopolyphosphatase / guanosine-5'-triphosphate,3'-diphosphate pyrophosphatase